MEGSITSMHVVGGAGRIEGVGGGGPVGSPQRLLEVAVNKQIGSSAVVGGASDQAEVVEVSVTSTVQVHVEFGGRARARDGNFPPNRLGFGGFVQVL